MAHYVDEGAQVTLVTCTLGEEGEILVPDLEHLAADHGDELGEHRIRELQAAMDYRGSPTSSGSVVTTASGTPAWPGPPDGTATARDVLREGTFWTTDLLVAADRAGATHPRSPAPGPDHLQRDRWL